MMTQLVFGWSTAYMAFQYHLEEALHEKKGCIGTYPRANNNPIYAIFSRKYYNSINDLDHTKKYDYCFIGSMNTSYHNRKWVIDFAKNYFTSNSIFINTSSDDKWATLGTFDRSNEKLGYCPKDNRNNQSRQVQYRHVDQNKFYFETMCQSKYILSPAGDSEWSFRFYEVLMCKALPVVKSWHHTYRTKEESEIKYNYILESKVDLISDIDYDRLISENTCLFEKFHMLE